MTDLIELTAQARPWAPTDDAELIHVLDEYNIPLAGILRQQGHDYLFVCAAGEEDDSNIWLYSILEEAEVNALRKSGPSEVMAEMRNALQNRTVVAAMAIEWELFQWEHFDAGIEPPAVLVRRFLKRLEVRLHRINQNIVTLEREAADSSDELALAL